MATNSDIGTASPVNEVPASPSPQKPKRRFNKWRFLGVLIGLCYAYVLFVASGGGIYVANLANFFGLAGYLAALILAYRRFSRKDALFYVAIGILLSPLVVTALAVAGALLLLGACFFSASGQ